MDVRKIRLILELRESGISNSRVLSAIEKIPREKFISENYRNQAYENIALPIENNQTISQPYVVAKMTELLDVNLNHKVLEIGTGSWYQCAILSHLSRRVYTIERIKNLYDKCIDLYESAVKLNLQQNYPEIKIPLDRAKEYLSKEENTLTEWDNIKNEVFALWKQEGQSYQVDDMYYDMAKAYNYIYEFFSLFCTSIELITLIQCL